MKAYNIQWDTDGDADVLADLPSEIEIPEGMVDGEKISDYISNETGFCHGGFSLSSHVYLVHVCNYDENNVPNAVGSFHVVSETKPTEIELKAMPEWDDIKQKLGCEGISGIEYDVEPEEGFMVVYRELTSFSQDDVRLEKCTFNDILAHECDLEVYCDPDMWDDIDNTYSIKVDGRTVGFIVFDDDDSFDNAIWVYQMEIFEELRLKGIGRAAIKHLVGMKPDTEIVTGLASFVAVPFWDSLGASFADGGEFDIADAWEYAKYEDEDRCEELLDDYWESALAFTLDVEDLSEED